MFGKLCVSSLFLFVLFFITPYKAAAGTARVWGIFFKKSSPTNRNYGCPWRLSVQDLKEDLFSLGMLTGIFFLVNLCFSYILQWIAPVQYAIHGELALRIAQGQDFTLWEVISSLLNIRLFSMEPIFIYAASILFSLTTFFFFKNWLCQIFDDLYIPGALTNIAVAAIVILVLFIFCFITGPEPYYESFWKSVVAILFTGLKKLGISFSIACVGASGALGAVVSTVAKIVTDDRNIGGRGKDVNSW